MKTRFLFLFLALVSSTAFAQQWPAKPVRFILPNGPGSGPDVMARLAALRLEQQLGQPFVVDNRPGANFFIAAEAIARAAPDGYTIGQGSATMSSINMHTFKSLPYDPEKDFEYIGCLIDTIWGFFGVHPSVPARSFREFIDLAKKSPGKYTYGVTVPSNGMWTKYVLKQMGGVEMVEVTYKAPTQQVQDLVSGRIHATTNGFTGYEPFLRDGRLRPLVAISPVRHPDWPDLQPITDFVPGAGYNSWIGVIAPKGVPQPMVTRLNAALDAVVKDPEFSKRALALGWTNRGGARTPPQMAQLVRDAHKHWGEIVRDAGVKPE
jgi:tripartite-type tricarboxylate transporter receptor subunit TctC